MSRLAAKSLAGNPNYGAGLILPFSEFFIALNSYYSSRYYASTGSAFRAHPAGRRTSLAVIRGPRRDEDAQTAFADPYTGGGSIKSSTGYEDAEDITADIDQALKAATK